MKILLVNFEVLGEPLDPSREQSHLDLYGTRIVGILGEFGHNPLFLFLGKRHDLTPNRPLPGARKGVQFSAKPFGQLPTAGDYLLLIQGLKLPFKEEEAAVHKNRIHFRTFGRVHQVCQKVVVWEKMRLIQS